MALFQLSDTVSPLFGPALPVLAVTGRKVVPSYRVATLRLDCPPGSLQIRSRITDTFSRHSPQPDR